MANTRFVDRIEDLASRDTILSLSGLAFMEQIRDGQLAHPPIARTLGYHLEVVEPGRIVFRGAPGFAHLNPMGGVHGGWYGTLLDSCMSCAVQTNLAKGQVYTTLEYKINITRAVPIGREILAEGIVQHAGRTTGVADGTIRDAETGKLYATGSATCLVMTP